jgi:hypothetical protein
MIRMPEEWRTIAEFPRYEVSSLGRVRRKDTGRLRKVGRRKGYACCVFWDEKGHYRFVHRVMCIAWHGPPPFEGAHAAHLDGVRDHNAPENLVWASAQENNAHRIGHGTDGRGERNPRAKYTEREVREVHRLRAAGVRNIDVAERLGMPQGSASKIYAGIIWPHLHPDNAR